jgi:hypothetical protein
MDRENRLIFGRSGMLNSPMMVQSRHRRVPPTGANGKVSCAGQVNYIHGEPGEPVWHVIAGEQALYCEARLG